MIDFLTSSMIKFEKNYERNFKGSVSKEQVERGGADYGNLI